MSAPMSAWSVKPDVLRAGITGILGSRSTLGVQQNLLSSYHEELQISPEMCLRRYSFAQPDQHFFALVEKTIRLKSYHT